MKSRSSASEVKCTKLRKQLSCGQLNRWPGKSIWRFTGNKEEIKFFLSLSFPTFDITVCTERFNITTAHCVHTVYSAAHGFWPEEELAELADGPTGRGKMARGGCLFAWNFSVTRSTVVT